LCVDAYEIAEEISNTKVESFEILEYILLEKRWNEMNKMKI